MCDHNTPGVVRLTASPDASMRSVFVTVPVGAHVPYRSHTVDPTATDRPDHAVVEVVSLAIVVSGSPTLVTGATDVVGVLVGVASLVNRMASTTARAAAAMRTRATEERRILGG